MMGLLSTIRGKRDTPAIGSTAVGPIASKDKKLVIQEWPRLLEHQPNLFQIAWTASAARSNSIKKAFGIGDEESPQDNTSFMKLSETIAAFFEEIVCFSKTRYSRTSDEEKKQFQVITMQLDDDIVRSTCEQLGARHVDFIARGFNSNFWDIFLVCMAETIDEALCSYVTDDGKRAELILAYQRHGSD
ncbi:hypothetical protein KIN20_033459 [Parelaphostrongylus tenuis]|uniref:Globin domain-containing protein n=1 Tax=Parelaphostrongylus tenuis TaxID=148309 RepID=A0AAD5WI99_PARTN|nr:hypothetical protein KIN20_033459 [Parelaphostrongylus tenuis]